jgi:hypothetical protein
MVRIPPLDALARCHAASLPRSEAAKRGPKPALAEGVLLAAMREDLKGPPFTGKKHR